MITTSRMYWCITYENYTCITYTLYSLHILHIHCIVYMYYIYIVYIYYIYTALLVSLYFMCHCTSCVTVLHVPLYFMCHCTSCVTVLHVSLYFMCHCTSCVTVLHVSLYFMCHCTSCVTVLHVPLYFMCPDQYVGLYTGYLTCFAWLAVWYWITYITIKLQFYATHLQFLRKVLCSVSWFVWGRGEILYNISVDRLTSSLSVILLLNKCTNRVTVHS